MSYPFNLNRPPVGDDEINKRKDFEQLVKSFKEQSLKQAQGDESWWKNKKIRYSTIIAGVTVVCTITYLSLQQKNKTSTNTKKHETLTTPQKKSQSAPAAFISAPSAKLKTAYSKYTLNAGSGGKITHPSSTRITVPKNALVNKEGKQLIGEVTIEYKEMHDMGDVILNGIPMQYDSAGRAYCLETAGMFDIRAYQNGEPVFVKPGEEIKVELASRNPVDKFNQYYLDTVKRNWVYLKRDQLPAQSPAPQATQKQETSNPKIQSLKRDIEVVLPKKRDSVEKYTAKSISALAQPAEPKKPVKASGKRPEFTLDADTKDFPELASYRNTIFEVGPENKNYNPAMHDITWNDVQLLPGPTKGVNYILELRYRNQTQRLVVYPVLNGKDFDNAMSVYEKQFEAYTRALEIRQNKEKQLLLELQSKQQQYLKEQLRKKEELEKEQLRLRLESQNRQNQQLLAGFATAGAFSQVERVFAIGQFGIYNSDCPHPMPGQSNIRPVFVLKEKGKLLIPDKVYLIDYESRTVVGYNSLASSFTLPVDENKSYGICLFKNGKVFFCDQSQVKNTLDTKSREFKVKALPDHLEHPTEFKKFLEI